MKISLSSPSTGRRWSRWSGRTAVAATLVAAVLLAGSPARASHDADEATGAYEPHAGYLAPARSPGRLAPVTGALMGTHSHDDDDLAPQEQGIVELEQALARTMDINNRYYGDFDHFAQEGAMSWMETWDIESGRIPLVGWGCTDSAKISSGSLDEVIRKTAQVMKAFGHEFFMRYCWEMDGRRKQSKADGGDGPGHGHNGNATEFVAAWRHLWRIFQEEGATNVIWAWTANAAGFKDPRPYTDDQPPAPFFYPGDQYVDWIASDGYNWGVSERDQGDRWRHALEIFDEFMVFARQHPKPIMIGEYGVQEQSSDPEAKPDWFRQAHQVFMDVPKAAECAWCGAYSDVAAVIYFDVDYAEHGDWRIMSSPESQAAYADAANATWFNQIHTIGWAPAGNRPGAPPPPPISSPPGEAPSGGQPSPASPASPPRPSGDGANGSTHRSGYWMLGQDGRVYPFGDAVGYGQAATPEAVDLESTPSGGGYWVVDRAGRVFAYGDAGDLGGVKPSQLVTGEVVTSLSASPWGRGYWLFTSLGRVLAFGDAPHLGDMAGTRLNAPVLDSVPTPSGRGYWMVASDGGIFSFGDARFFGSMGGTRLNAPVQSLVPDPDGLGYWLVASDGGVFAFDATFRGSMGSMRLNRPVTGMVTYGDGYLMVGEDGGIFNFSDRAFAGSLGATPPTHPIVTVAATR